MKPITVKYDQQMLDEFFKNRVFLGKPLRVHDVFLPTFFPTIS